MPTVLYHSVISDITQALKEKPKPLLQKANTNNTNPIKSITYNNWHIKCFLTNNSAKKRNLLKRIFADNFATLVAKRGRKATGLTQIAEPPLWETRCARKGI